VLGKGLWLKNMTIFDSNAVLRYILQDNDKMAAATEMQINDNDCFIPTEVVAEMVYVLSKVYKIPRSEVSSAILGILSIESISTTNFEMLLRGLEAYASTKLDFVDCLMVGYQESGYEVFTFDNDLQKYLKQ